MARPPGWGDIGGMTLVASREEAHGLESDHHPAHPRDAPHRALGVRPGRGAAGIAVGGADSDGAPPGGIAGQRADTCAARADAIAGAETHARRLLARRPVRRCGQDAEPQASQGRFEAPGFSLATGFGEHVTLAGLLADHEAVVLVFYRGFF